MPSCCGEPSGDVGGAAYSRPMVAALSPSRASDFMTCPMLYRFRVIDKLPSPPTQATARGTLVHAVLERLFDLPADGAHDRRRRRARPPGVGAPRGRRARHARPAERARREHRRLVLGCAGAARDVVRPRGPDPPRARRARALRRDRDRRPRAARLRRPPRRRTRRRDARRRLQDGPLARRSTSRPRPSSR